MSKYFDKLLKMNESLDAELKARGLVNEDSKDTIEISKDALTDDQKKEILIGKGVDKETVDGMTDPKEIDAALSTSLNTDENKAGANESGAVPLEDLDWDGPAILKFDNPNEPDYGGFYVKDGEWTSDIQAATEFDSKEAAQEKLDDLVNKKGMDGNYLYIWSAKSKFDEGEDVSEEVVIRIDDDDLDMHGYLKSDDGLDVRELEWTDDIKAAKVFQHEELGQNAIEAICNKFHYDPATFKTVSVDPRADEPYEDDESEQWISLNPLDPTATTLG